MYFKENWQSMAEKEPPFGHVDIFQTGPKPFDQRRAEKGESSFPLLCTILL